MRTMGPSSTIIAEPSLFQQLEFDTTDDRCCAMLAATTGEKGQQGLCRDPSPHSDMQRLLAFTWRGKTM